VRQAIRPSLKRFAPQRGYKASTVAHVAVGRRVLTTLDEVARKKVLYVVHNHPVVRPGGAESYALELYEGMRSSPEFEPLLLARLGGRGASEALRHPGAPFATVGPDQNQYFLVTDQTGMDYFLRTYADKDLYTSYIADFVETIDPDVVHFQHTQFIGYDMVTLVRRMLPKAPIVYTLHEYHAICNRLGQMVRTGSEELCTHASPRRCNRCYPERTQQQFFLRERLIKSHLSNVDLFLAPSRFLLERHVQWGIPREKLRFEDYGRLPQPRVLENDGDGERPRVRLGWFSAITPFKGLEVVIEAMKMLRDRAPEVTLHVYGTLKTTQGESRSAYEELLRSAGDNVTYGGEYSRPSVPQLMSEVDWVVVSSRWWENSPLVIQEAFMHGRPVICSDIGGMAEKVVDGVSGLHFTVSNATSLAETIVKAVRTPGLWSKLRAGIPEVHSMREHVANLTEIYDELLERRAPRPDVPELATA
jgi:glycosyltransferase involved in cell wall biosynthesis